MSIQIFNALGSEVVNFNKIKQIPGKHIYEYIPGHDAQTTVVYYLKFESEGKVVVKKLTRLLQLIELSRNKYRKSE